MLEFTYVNNYIHKQLLYQFTIHHLMAASSSLL